MCNYHEKDSLVANYTINLKHGKKHFKVGNSEYLLYYYLYISPAEV